MFERVKLISVNDHIWLMNDQDESTSYLILGSERALIIDTMNGYENGEEIARTVTDLPVVVVNTHGHPDHIYGNIYFDEVYLHPDDWELAKRYMEIPEYKKQIKLQHRKNPRFRPIEDGDIFELGGISLEVFHTPGHTPGGICLLDRKDRILFTGDSIIEQTWMQMEESLPIGVFLQSLERLQSIRNDFDFILTGHTKEKLEEATLYEAHKKAVKEVLEGKQTEDEPYQWFGGWAMAHPYGREPRRIVYK